MNLSDYIKESERKRTDLAKELGVGLSYLYQMEKGIRAVSPLRAVAIERATDGHVTRRDLRPDDWHLIWPELAAADFPPNPPAVLIGQARAAIKNVAQEVAHVGA